MAISVDLKRYAMDLANLDGVAAHETKIAEYVKKELTGVPNVVIERDGLGSVAAIMKKSDTLPTISFTAHMDEVGFMVTKIDDNGFIKFAPIGGWWGHVVLAKLLKITTRDNKEIVGVVGSPPPHLLRPEEAKLTIPLKNMFIDIGANSKKEVESLGIKIGDMITPKTLAPFEVLNDRIIAKAHDDRISVAAGIEIMKRLSHQDLNANVIFVASVQEEVGLRGARTSSYKWKPDVGFAIDVTIANDTPGMEQRDTKLGSGVALSNFDSSIIANPKLVQKMESIAKENGIKYTFDSLTGGGTDAGVIHLSKDGVIAMTLSIPSRYMHSHHSIIDLKDVEATIDLVVNFIKKFDQNTLEALKFS